MNARRWIPRQSTLTLFLFTASVLFLVSAGVSAASDPFELTVQLKWRHQAQFAGNYVADQKGYYAEEGLTVRFLPGGPKIDINRPVLSGEAQIGINAAADLISARAEGAPVIAISTIYQRRPVVYVSRRERNSRSPMDFKGRTVGVGKSDKMALLAVLNRSGLSPDDVNLVVRPSISAWETTDIDVWSVYLAGSLTELEQKGYDLNLVFPDDYGVHFYADTILTTERFAAENPDVLTRFLRATIKGWEYAIAHPREAAGMIAPYNSSVDVESESVKMASSIPLIMTDIKRIGWMEMDTWKDMEETLSQLCVIAGRVDVGSMVTTDFLPAN